MFHHACAFVEPAFTTSFPAQASLIFHLASYHTIISGQDVSGSRFGGIPASVRLDETIACHPSVNKP